MTFYEYTHTTPNANPTPAEMHSTAQPSPDATLIRFPDEQVRPYAFDSAAFERLWVVRRAIRAGFWTDAC